VTALLDWVEAEPDITMAELAAKLEAEQDVVAHPASLSRVLLKAGLSFKKTLLASEAEREHVRQARDEWRAHRQPRMRDEIHRLVFLDETGTTTKMTRLRGRARRGARLKADAPFGHWATQTFIAGLRCDGLTAPWVIDQPMNRQIFDTYVETQLAPTLQMGDVVILDNLPSHKSAKAEAALKQRGAWFLFLPPYSPDLNPIEMAFAKLKAHLRRIGARTIDTLWRAIGDICALYSEQECSNYFKDAGYAPV
jgi:transposase